MSADGHRLRFTWPAGDVVGSTVDRRLAMGCGAVVAHLRLSLRHLGLAPQVALLRRLTSADLITVLSRPSRPTDDVVASAPDLGMPRADSGPGTDGLPAAGVTVESFLRTVRAQVAALGVQVDHVPFTAVAGVLTDCVAAVDHPMLSAPTSTQAEGWLEKQTGSGDRAGRPTGGSSIADLTRHLGPGSFSSHHPLPLRPTGAEDTVEGRPLRIGTSMFVLSTCSNDSSDWAATGQAAAILSLVAAAAGVAVAVLEHRDDPSAPRSDHLDRLLDRRRGDRFPQLMFSVAPVAGVPQLERSADRFARTAGLGP